MDILNEKIEGLVKKAEKSKMPYGILKKVYDRGMAAWKTGHRPGTTPQQWAFARVNSFITKSSGTWGKADKDLAKQVRGEEVERRKTASEMLGQVREAVAQNDAFVVTGGPGDNAQKVIAVFKDKGNGLKDAKKARDNYDKKNKPTKPSHKARIYRQTRLSQAGQRLKPGEKIMYSTFGNKQQFTKVKEDISEKLPKDADAGDYVKDFKKSDAPQFKGKSDKKKQKMAIAAYLDSKEEVELEEGQAGRFRSAGAELERYAKKSGRMDKNDFIKAAGMMKKGDSHGLVKFVKSLDTEPRDYVIQTVKRAVGKDLTQKMFSVKIKEEKRQLKDPKKEAMVMKVKDSGSIQVIDKKDLKKYLSKGYIQVEDNIKEENCPDCDEDPCKCKSLQESGHTDVASMKTQVQIATDALQKMNTELGKLSDEEDLPTWWTNKVATAVSKLDGMADYIDAKHDQGDKMNEDNLQEKERTYTVIHIKKGKEIIKTSKGTYDAAKKYAKMKGLKSTAGVDVHLMEDNITEERVFVVRFEKEGMRFAVPFSDMKTAKDGEKILKKSAGVSDVSITKDILKPGVKFKRTQEGKIVKESKMGELFLDMQMDAQDMNEREFIKTYSKMGFQAAELKSLFKQFNEEVDNSLMAQATRVISQTSIKEKIDPADVDNIATVDDRKAADKNIIIQLRRAQDMKGKADVTFKDKPSKKEKIDIRVINKALDMFDKMKPNDKAKMQTTIGKSYRDLLKTVQRGRI